MINLFFSLLFPNVLHIRPRDKNLHFQRKCCKKSNNIPRRKFRHFTFCYDLILRLLPTIGINCPMHADSRSLLAITAVLYRAAWKIRFCGSSAMLDANKTTLPHFDISRAVKKPEVNARSIRIYRTNAENTNGPQKTFMF